MGTSVGIPKEVKNHEYRVGATPTVVQALVNRGHRVLVQTMAGACVGFDDASYQGMGAEIVTSSEEVYQAELIVKVKEPQPCEYSYLREGQVLFTYLHLAPDPQQTKALLDRGVIGIAYETVTDQENRLCLLTPMSEIAGRVSIQVGATALQAAHGGRGVLLGGVPGVAAGKVVVLGGGIVGTEAARMALGLGADVMVFDTNLSRLRVLDSLWGMRTRYSTPDMIEQEIAQADLVIGAVLIPGKLAPRLVSLEMEKSMLPGSVVVDVSIDQGGCFESSKVTSHSEPTYEVNGVVHYGVPNMPGACSKTATQALTNATMPYILKLADLGYKKALKDDFGFCKGLNVCLGHVTYEGVANDLGYPYVSADRMLQ